MECTLPTWASYAATAVLMLIAAGAAFGVFEAFSRAGQKRHPGITFGDQHSRTLWNSLGVFLGLFVAFPAVGIVIADIGRPPLCDAVGEWRERPTYPAYDHGALQREIDILLREHERLGLGR